MNENNCDVCNSELKIIKGNYGPHYGKVMCPNCGFKGWARNPNSSKIGTTSEKRIGRKSVLDVCQFHGSNEEFCFLCLRKKEQLGYCETLTIDHIRELSTEEENKKLDTLENMQVLCTACHKLKNWVRLYGHWHFIKREENGDTKTNTKL